MENDKQLEESMQDSDISFELDATEEELLEEFGVLMAAEYGYMSGRPDTKVRVTPTGNITIQTQVKKGAKKPQKSSGRKGTSKRG